MNNAEIPIITSQQIASILPRIDVISAMRNVFTSLALGCAIQPAQKVVLLPENRGDFINYFGVDLNRKQLGTKISPYIVTGEQPIITAWTLILSTETGQPLMLCDASLLTTARTAATTALAVDYLAPKDAKVLTIIGTGAVARAHIRYAQNIRDWDEIRVLSRSGNVTAEMICSELNIPTELVTVCLLSDEALIGTDVLMLCTSSATPVIDMQHLLHPCLITSISTNAPSAHEISPQKLSDMDVYCDYRHTTPTVAGEMVIATQNTDWSPQKILGDLPELVTGACPKPSYQRHVFFRSLGLGIEDIAIADSVLSYFKEKESLK